MSKRKRSKSSIRSTSSPGNAHATDTAHRDAVKLTGAVGVVRSQENTNARTAPIGAVQAPDNAHRSINKKPARAAEVTRPQDSARSASIINTSTTGAARPTGAAQSGTVRESDASHRGMVKTTGAAGVVRSQASMNVRGTSSADTVRATDTSYRSVVKTTGAAGVVRSQGSVRSTAYLDAAQGKTLHPTGAAQSSTVRATDASCRSMVKTSGAAGVVRSQASMNVRGISSADMVRSADTTSSSVVKLTGAVQVARPQASVNVRGISSADMVRSADTTSPSAVKLTRAVQVARPQSSVKVGRTSSTGAVRLASITRCSVVKTTGAARVVRPPGGTSITGATRSVLRFSDAAQRRMIKAAYETSATRTNTNRSIRICEKNLQRSQPVGTAGAASRSDRKTEQLLACAHGGVHGRYGAEKRKAEMKAARKKKRNSLIKTRNKLRRAGLLRGRSTQTNADGATDDSIAFSGLSSGYHATYASVKGIKVAGKAVGKAPAAVKTTIKAVRRTPKRVRAVARFIKSAVTTVAGAIGQTVKAVGAALAAIAPLIPVIIIILLILVVVVLVSTWTLKSTDDTMTKVWKYASNLDAKFTVSVNQQLSMSGYDGIELYINDVKTGGTQYELETDLITLLTYYDAMFEGYDAVSNSDAEPPEDDLDDVGGDADASEDGGEDDGDDSTIKDRYGKVKKYSKNLWNQNFALHTTIRHEAHSSSGGTGSASGGGAVKHYYYLEVHVSQKNLQELIRQNQCAEGEAYTPYDDVFDTPFGYISPDAAELMKIRDTEVGTFAALETVGNPFDDGTVNDDGESAAKPWTTAQRYGYYVDVPNNKTRKKDNKGLYITAQSGDSVYGAAGEVTVDGSKVKVTGGNRRITYGNLATIHVSDGERISRGTKIGTVASESIVGSPALYLEYETTNGLNKKINPLFVVSGASLGASGGGSGNDIVSVGLSQVGVTETGVNNVLYNTWFYGRPVNGKDYPWCAAFVSWCADQCGYIAADLVPKVAGCWGYRDYYAARNQFYKVSDGVLPQAGDFVLFSSGGYPNGGTHIGLVTSFDGTYIYTVEGNTSSDGSFNANGGCVWTKRHIWTQGSSTSGIWGICRPDYPATAGGEESEDVA